MATEHISLNSLYKKAMHRPSTKDGFTLYTKTEGYNGTMEGESSADKSEDYKRMSSIHYNSPTNIRKVFITGKGITVQYYTPFISTKQVPRWNHVALEKDLFKIAEKKLTYNDDKNMYEYSKIANEKVSEPIKYKVAGNGIGIFANPWVCNNIEEIYFDWTMLISDDVGPYFQEFATREWYTNFITGQYGPQEIQNYNALKAFFMQFNSGGIRELRRRFPRLKVIAMISKLEDVLNHPSMQKVDLEFSSLEESTKTWYAVNRELVAASGSVVLHIGLEQDLEKPNKNFTVKSNQYKFDYDKLDSVIKSYLTKIEDAKRARYGSATDSDEADAEEDLAVDFEIEEIEQKFLDIEQQYGEKTLKYALIYAFRGTDEINGAELKHIFESFSKPNRKRMAAMVGINNID